ncbi:MAG TPA: hypothetical protein VN374_08180 [Desulfitobacteriaceae bacterium]|nr:hypothetical protein [Desulfitobacteriaceae bacterium]
MEVEGEGESELTPEEQSELKKDELYGEIKELIPDERKKKIEELKKERTLPDISL